MTEIDLTKEEEAAVRSLKRLAKKWPKSLWLFSASGTLWVMKYKPDGERAMDGFGVDQDYVLAKIDGIPNDGGDW